MEEEKRELRKYFREQQEKYNYYIIALCVAAIGYSIHFTMGEALKWSQIPLGLAIVFWGVSIYCGLTFQKYVISSFYNNHDYLNIIDGKDDDVGKKSSNIEFAKNIMKETLIKNEKKAINFSKWQNRLFFGGFISFLVWHILEMYLSYSC